MNAVATGNMEERKQKVLDHYPMVRAIACRIHRRLPRAIELDDLISAGVTGLMEAMDRYEPSHSVPFETYARYRVQGAIVDALRATDWVPRSVRRKADHIERTRNHLRFRLSRTPNREEMAAALSITTARFDGMHTDSEIRPLLSLDASVGDEHDTPLIEQVSNTPDFLESMQQDQLRELVVAAVHGLPERERTAIGLYYFHELSLKEVGTVLGVSESRACQLCGQGIKRLRKRLRKHVA